MFAKKLWIVIILSAILIICLIILFKPLTDFGKRMFARTSDWYAVHLVSGQVYFGQIESIKLETIQLANVYYLETYQKPEEQNMQSKNFQIQPIPQQAWQLVKQSDSQPFLTDQTLFINRSAVLFWERLKPDSEIVKLIEKNLESKK